jgi:hypothetical protein
LIDLSKGYAKVLPSIDVDSAAFLKRACGHELDRRTTLAPFGGITRIRF